MQLVQRMARAQIDGNRFFSCENPLTSLAWHQPCLTLLHVAPFQWVRLDQRGPQFNEGQRARARHRSQVGEGDSGRADGTADGQHPRCRVGLVGPSGKPLQKATAIYSTCQKLIQTLDLQCGRDHAHEVVQGGTTRMSENYSWGMASRIADNVMNCTTTLAQACNGPEDDVLETSGSTVYFLDVRASVWEVRKRSRPTLCNQAREHAPNWYEWAPPHAPPRLP